ncbi:UBX domain-containing protein 2 [Taphrina deformans PYCC 5710]|uniref:UBX domain-containing protein 2 n=1 Tax=Taphrina deformans (strain PYCC 5710 / ATCC 11124 / CBS 356.35 / IMI 108563 / JCM 9778 / NBRC 8474) TaxID=1097556 RepID=R4XAE4_TAPDE|nr:UBX domain-containing protein 2 [Taphrina deformans PYCC 5710]|eukprot:CCG82477.1 UBX domain-containing protein 2 [Taphrina deformans PYCC 5710]
MDEETILNFCAVTNSEPKHAERYLAFSGGDLDTAVMMYFETGGQLPEDAPASRPGVSGGSDSPITFDSSPDEREPEDDEAMARRLAQEWSAQNPEVRAPIAPTRQVLQDSMSDSFDPYSLPQDLTNSFRPLSSMNGGGRPQNRGVFNQAVPSVWDGADEESARLFQPPFDIMSNIDLDTARNEARKATKWIMINLQDNSDFASQTLNRDLWKDKTVKALVKENFVFLQYTKDSDDGLQYTQFYPFEKYPHIAILDPRTGERVKMWSESLPPLEFLSEVSEFLDRFSLDESRQNPVQKKARPTPKALDAMSEEEQMNAAIMASVGGSMTPAKDESNNDDDHVEAGEDNSTSIETDDSPFAKIPAVLHDEPAQGATTTRIQLRMAAGRTVRRFNLDDPVQRIFEYVKAGVSEAAGKRFKIVFNRTNLIDKLPSTILDAGLKNASLVVEFED